MYFSATYENGRFQGRFLCDLPFAPWNISYCLSKLSTVYQASKFN